MKMTKNAEIMTKQRAREYVREASLKITPEKITAANKRISTYCYSVLRQQGVASIFIYVSLQSEVDTHELIKRALKDKVEVYVPKLIGDNEMVAARLYTWERLIMSKYKYHEPKTTKNISSKIDTVIAPGLAFSKEGARLGRGLGCYDRWLSENSYSEIIGLAYEHQILDTVPTSQHDINVTQIITEKRRIICTGANL